MDLRLQGKSTIKKLFIGIAVLFIVALVYLLRAQKETQVQNTAIYINEVCPANLSVVKNSRKEFPKGWVELYNAGEETVSLKDYCLSDSEKYSADRTLPETELAPGEYAFIFLDDDPEMIKEAKENGEICLALRLDDRKAATLCLLDAEGRLIDRMEIPAGVKINMSYGRDAEGKGSCQPMACTPGTANAAARPDALENLAVPELSVKSGVYRDDFYLSIEAAEGVQIYYTLDGSVPGPEDILYTEPLYICDASPSANRYVSRTDLSCRPYHIADVAVDKATIVRAAACAEDGRRSRTVTGVYYVDGGSGIGEKYGGDVATLSVVGDPEGLFGYEDGIFVLGKSYDEWLEMQGDDVPAEQWDNEVIANFSGRGNRSEREVCLSFFENGVCSLEQTVGIKIRGQSSNVGRQKGLNVSARRMYDGNPVLGYDLFHNGRYVKRFMLKKSICIFRDGFLMSLAEDLRVAPLHYRPVSFFLNGEYWGLYTILEKYDRQFFRDYYGIREENLVIIKNKEVEEGSEADLADFYDVIDFAVSHDLAEEENYKILCDRIDIDSYIDYYCIRSYADDTDCSELWNMMVWKSSKTEKNNSYTDGRWRWVAYDMDASLGDPSRNNLKEEIREGRPAYLEHSMMKALLRNQEFRERFLRRYVYLLQTNFAPEHVLAAYDVQAAMLRGAFESQYAAVQGAEGARSAAEGELQHMRNFYRMRRDYVMAYLQDYFELSGEEMEQIRRETME